MSVDNSTITTGGDALLLHVKAGMSVVVTEGGQWWIGNVIYAEGGAHDPEVPTLFQVADVATGVIHWANADLVTQIVPRV